MIERTAPAPSKTPHRARHLATALLCVAIAGSLQACIEMAIGTAVVGGLAANDRRTLGAQTEDKAIAIKGEQRVAQIAGSDGHVNLASFNRKVLLTGEVRDEATKAAVEREAAAIEGVTGVINELMVGGVSNYTSRSNDALITGKVKASFVDAKELYANTIKVVTERGTVYLLGRVSAREANQATEIARGVPGVLQVVRAFEVIDESELKRPINPQPGATAVVPAPGTVPAK